MIDKQSMDLSAENVTLKLPVRLSEAARMKVKVTLLVRREEMGQKLTARSILRI